MSELMRRLRRTTLAAGALSLALALPANAEESCADLLRSYVRLQMERDRAQDAQINFLSDQFIEIAEDLARRYRAEASALRRLGDNEGSRDD